MNDEMDDGDNLSRFFGLLKNFNAGNDLDIKLRLQIEEYFAHRWNNDLNQAFILDSDLDIFA